MRVTSICAPACRCTCIARWTSIAGSGIGRVWLVPQEAVTRADAMVTSGMRLGEALQGMGALNKESLSAVLKDQIRRKLTRLFCVAEGSLPSTSIRTASARVMTWPSCGRSAYLVLSRHPLGLRLAPRHPRVVATVGQEFRLAAVSPSFIAAMVSQPTIPWWRPCARAG